MGVDGEAKGPFCSGCTSYENQSNSHKGRHHPLSQAATSKVAGACQASQRGL